MQILKDISLTLFFTSGVSLNTWAEVGNLDREVAIYQRLVEHLKTVNFVTYGGRNDMQYAELLGDIGLFPTLWNGSMTRNIARLLFRHWRMLKKSDVLKTNQIQGSEIPIWLKERFDKKLIVRCGYLHGCFTERQGYDKETVTVASSLERKAFEAADIGVLPTARDRDWVVKTHGIPREKLRVIPNYVDTEVFIPAKGNRDIRFDLVFVGRSGSQKNLSALLEAILFLKTNGRSIRLLLIGGCTTDQKLQDISKNKKLDVTFLENVSNKELPRYLCQASAFILPSHYEGHPKVLLEAMSCGLPCIGTDVEGIKELIEHKVTGYLCKTDSQSIADSIEVVLSDKTLHKEIGENTRRYVVENYSLERVLKMELDVIREVIAT